MSTLLDDHDQETIIEQLCCYLCEHSGLVKVRQRADGYVTVRVSVLLHRLITNAGKGEEVDHRNGDRGDNRRTNLRCGSASANRSNQQSPKRPGRPSQFRGVSLHRSRKGDPTTRWRATIKVDRKTYELGYFKNERDAALAYDHAALAHHGSDYRWFNFPRSLQLGKHMARPAPGVRGRGGAMTATYEARHLELREALAPSDDPRPLLERQVALWSFDERAGPLVDDLVAAVREEGHYGSCSLLGKGGECDCPMRFLAALDEEAARG